ncbi:laminin subunit gamma-3 isoform X2 [Echeneis naucrates]|uniref:laminin subunit gamma-3 isoform X2 n=1 Tax=Echeneis naucrates TaxID=173247 RepID=UPI0011142737|nr:laminin subunit gamma-3-like isoform X2 [Echeneis naucrates]
MLLVDMATSFAAASLLLPFLLHCHLLVWAAMDSCYDEEGAPSRCMPRFENVAFNRTVDVSNVCGDPPEDYCMQTGSTRSCHHCNALDPDRSHNASLLTDFNRNEEPTWWQSQSMYYGIQHPNSVNLTLHLGKAFEITYVRLKFYTSRPESFAIYKRTEEDGPWMPYQYYSASCRKTYGKDAKGYIRPGDDERTALCTDEFSDISPLSGGNVAFSTLEGRPSAYNFDQSVMLQEWVTATDLLISLDRLNTFGDEFFKDAKVLRSYFYAISDFSVGGRCKCHGHASECVEGEHSGLVCSCQHHTVGADCQRCHPFYQDRPWARATGDSANECLKCNCSGRSDECVFDMEQYRSTGSGGRCLSCSDNTDGPHCERCRESHYRNSPVEPCLPCNCNINGSVSLQCDVEGRCACRAGVTGEKCDTCRAGFHSLGPGGCRRCECNAGGTVDDCSHLDGRCHCKPNVEGQSCDRCKPGFFNLQQLNPAGCQPCFCFGHSLACSSAAHYTAVNISSDFIEDQDGWVGEFSGGQEYSLLWKEGEVYLLPLSEEDTGFYKAPEKFLGHQAYSYGQLLSITFTSETPELLPNHVALLLQGSGLTLSADLTPQPPLDHDPGLTPRHSFNVRLHENEMRFNPQLSAFDFQHLLYNLTAVRISNAGGHNYTSQLAGVTLTSALISSDPASPPASWVESCSCPPGFAGQFCEQCAPGFTREDPRRGPLSTCVPCSCHHHGSCHPETGVCECSDFTYGMTCDRCMDGYYGNALIGTPSDCRPCPCPGRTSCVQIGGTGQVVCTDCPPGQTGMRCQTCEDGYYGDPMGQSGSARPCVTCDCNGNVDYNALGICDHVTGRCLKCLGHTEGDHCQRCQRGFYGDAQNQTAVQKCKQAREAFIKQFSLLEAYTGTLLAQLHGITSTSNCSISMTEDEAKERGKDEESRGLCQTLADTVLIIRASQKQLKQATLDLDNVIIPFETMSGPNKWNTLVNNSKVLMKSHMEAADHIEAVASRAVRASKQTFSLLMDLLQDNSTEEYIRSLTEQIAQMQEEKENLTAQVIDTVAKQLALEEEAASLKLTLGDITSSLRQLALTDASSSPEPDQTQLNQTHLPDRTTERVDDLLEKTKELDQGTQTMDEHISKIRHGMEPVTRTVNKSLDMLDGISELQAQAQGAKVLALSAVVAGKEVESEAITLHREVGNMVREWPRRQAQTKAALKKERPLEEKVLADVRKRVSQIDQMLKPALENSSLSSNITKEVEQTAQALAKESKAILTQAKHTRTASAHLSSHLDSALQQLAEHEMLTDAANSQIPSEPEVSLASIKEDMEAAKLQLEAYSVTLTDLISKIDGNVPLERFDRILNDTARRLSMLRGSIDSPALDSKIQKLRAAAEEQQSQLVLIEQDIQEIREERDSLTDITLNLPQSCPQATGTGKG